MIDEDFSNNDSHNSELISKQDIKNKKRNGHYKRTNFIENKKLIKDNHHENSDTIDNDEDESTINSDVSSVIYRPPVKPAKASKR